MTADRLVKALLQVAAAGGRFERSTTYAIAAREFADEPLDLSSSPSAPQLLTHVIHDDVEAVVGLAEAEQRAGIPAVFCVMHRHPVSRPLWSDGGLEPLERIAELGHEIALHVDPFRLLLDGADLENAIAEALGELRALGYDVKVADLHGRVRDPTVGAPALAFFEEGIAHSIPGRLPEHFREYVGRASLGRLAREQALEALVGPITMLGGMAVEATFHVELAATALSVMSRRPPYVVLERPFDDLGRVDRRCLADALVLGPSIWRIYPSACRSGFDSVAA